SVDEVLLELRLQRRLDLFDLPHRLLDLAPVAPVEQRHSRAGAGGVADGGDVFQLTVGNEAEHHRIGRVDEGAEGAGEADRVDGLHALLFHEQLGTGIKGRLGELDGAHVVLRDRDARLPVVKQVGEGAALADDARASRGKRTVDHPVLGDDAGKIHLGDYLDDARAAYAGHARGGYGLLKARFVRPQLRADDTEAGL